MTDLPLARFSVLDLASSRSAASVRTISWPSSAEASGTLMAEEGILPQHALDQHREAVDAFAHNPVSSQ